MYIEAKWGGTDIARRTCRHNTVTQQLPKLRTMDENTNTIHHTPHATHHTEFSSIRHQFLAEAICLSGSPCTEPPGFLPEGALRNPLCEWQNCKYASAERRAHGSSISFRAQWQSGKMCVRIDSQKHPGRALQRVLRVASFQTLPYLCLR